MASGCPSGHRFEAIFVIGLEINAIKILAVRDFGGRGRLVNLTCGYYGDF